jgi:hypothetical protein
LILIVGANGNMGRRYQAVLRYLKRDFYCVDKDEAVLKVFSVAQRAHGILIATPTATHADYLNLFASLGKPILCEKPFTKNIAECRDLIASLKRQHCRASMVSQYKELLNPASKGPSHYDYYRHGGDGLVWDCIQIVGLAKGPVELKEESPVWNCQINGSKLNLAGMDTAYVQHISKWLRGETQSLDEILDFHEKTHDLHVGSSKNADHN